jgi:hypothetical protein
MGRTAGAEEIPYRLIAEVAEASFHAFVVQAWHVLEPGTSFVPGLHVDAICAHLQAVVERRIQDLIINVPPGHAKSLLACVFWPAWAWISQPKLRWLFGSYRADLAIRDSVKCRTLIQSEWYQSRWGDRYQLKTTTALPSVPTGTIVAGGDMAGLSTLITDICTVSLLHSRLTCEKIQPFAEEGICEGSSVV